MQPSDPAPPEHDVPSDVNSDPPPSLPDTQESARPVAPEVAALASPNPGVQDLPGNIMVNSSFRSRRPQTEKRAMSPHDGVPLPPIPGPPQESNARSVPAQPAPLTFPASAIVGSIGDLARLHARGTEVPEEFYFASGLTLLGSASSTDLTLKTGNEVEPRLYTTLLGQSYEAKKSTAMRRMVQFFEEMWAGGGGPQVAWGVGSAEGLARELNKKPSLVLAYDELSAFVDKSRVQSSVLMPMVASLFEGHNWDNSTKDPQNSISVRDAHLSLLGCCTTDTYSRMWTQEAIAIGFPNRLWVVGADRKRKVAWPEAPTEEEVRAIREKIDKQAKRLPFKFDISDEGKVRWTDWYNRLPSSEHVRRLDTIGFRLMPLIALTTDKECVDLKTVETVVAMLDYELELRRVTDPIDADNAIAGLEEKIRRSLAGGPLSKRDLQRKVHATRHGLWAYNAALQNLIRDHTVSGADGLYRLA